MTDLHITMGTHAEYSIKSLFWKGLGLQKNSKHQHSCFCFWPWTLTYVRKWGFLLVVSNPILILTIDLQVWISTTVATNKPSFNRLQQLVTKLWSTIFFSGMNQWSNYYKTPRQKINKNTKFYQIYDLFWSICTYLQLPDYSSRTTIFYKLKKY